MQWTKKKEKEKWQRSEIQQIVWKGREAATHRRKLKILLVYLVQDIINSALVRRTGYLAWWRECCHGSHNRLDRGKRRRKLNSENQSNQSYITAVTNARSLHTASLKKKKQPQSLTSIASFMLFLISWIFCFFSL